MEEKKKEDIIARVNAFRNENEELFQKFIQLPNRLTRAAMELEVLMARIKQLNVNERKEDAVLLHLINQSKTTGSLEHCLQELDISILNYLDWIDLWMERPAYQTTLQECLVTLNNSLDQFFDLLTQSKQSCKKLGLDSGNKGQDQSAGCNADKETAASEKQGNPADRGDIN